MLVTNFSNFSRDGCKRSPPTPVGVSLTPITISLWKISVSLGEQCGAVAKVLASLHYGVRILKAGSISGLSLLLIPALPRGLFFECSRRHPSLNRNQYFSIPIRSGNSGRRASTWDVPLQISIYFNSFSLLSFRFCLALLVILVPVVMDSSCYGMDQLVEV